MALDPRILIPEKQLHNVEIQKPSCYTCECVDWYRHSGEPDTQKPPSPTHTYISEWHNLQGDVDEHILCSIVYGGGKQKAY